MQSEQMIPEGMVPWAGGDDPPEDWDGGEVLLGFSGEPSTNRLHSPGLWFQWDNALRTGLKVVAYTPRAASPRPDTLACKNAYANAGSVTNAGFGSGSITGGCGGKREALSDAIGNAILTADTTNSVWRGLLLDRILALLAPAAGEERLSADEVKTVIAALGFLDGRSVAEGTLLHRLQAAALAQDRGIVNAATRPAGKDASHD